MEGYTLARRVREIINEATGSGWINDRTTYDLLYDAVKDFTKRVHFPTATQAINVLANNGAYNLNADYLALAYRNGVNQPFIKWTVNGSDSFINPNDYQDVVLGDDTSTSSIPASFSIIDAPQLAQVSGITSATGAVTNGECTLTDSTANFVNIYPGDFVHDTTAGIHGVVVAQTSATDLLCAMFNDNGTDSASGFGSGDSYIIVPQARHQIIFTPTPSAVATATVVYYQRPSPVFSPYRAYKLPPDAEGPICNYAAFLYKYRDREPNFGDSLYRFYEMFTAKVAREYRRAFADKSNFSVNLSKTNKRSTPVGGWR